MNLSNTIKTVRVKPDGTNYNAAAGSSAATSEYIDTGGYEGVRLMIGLGAVVSGAATSVKVSQCDTSGGSYADLLGSSITVADTDDFKVAVIDIYLPRKRYLKVVTSRATQNATVDFITAELYGTRKQATTDDATVISREIHVSPAEGTA